MEIPDFTYEHFQIIISAQLNNLIERFHKGFNLKRYYEELQNTTHDDYEKPYFNISNYEHKFASSFNYLDNGLIFSLEKDADLGLGININFDQKLPFKITKISLVRGMEGVYFRGLSIRSALNTSNTHSFKYSGQHYDTEYHTQYGFHERSNSFFLLSHDVTPNYTYFPEDEVRLDHSLIDRRLNKPPDRLTWEEITMSVLHILEIN